LSALRFILILHKFIIIVLFANLTRPLWTLSLKENQKALGLTGRPTHQKLAVPTMLPGPAGPQDHSMESGET
jgi:hypothetical protein